MVDALPGQCLRRAPDTNPLVVAVLRTKRLLREHCSAHVNTADLRVRCGINRDGPDNRLICACRSRDRPQLTSHISVRQVRHQAARVWLAPVAIAGRCSTRPKLSAAVPGALRAVQYFWP